MILERRDFLRLVGLSAGAAGVAGCRGRLRVPDRLVERALAGPGLESWKQTVCGLCEGGCGLSVRLVDDLPVAVKGNRNHPLNGGGLCPVGQGALEALYSADRLRSPLRRNGSGDLEPATWQEALEAIGGRLAELAASGRGDRVALISGDPGQLFHDLLEQFASLLGTASVSRLGEPPSLPFKLTQGLDRAPGFDLAGADLVATFGLDVLAGGSAPIHAVAALVGSRPTDQRATLLHVGTRLSPGIARAAERVTVRPGTHGAFALGVANVLVREGRYNASFIAEHTTGFEDWTDAEGTARPGFRRLLLERYYPDRAAQMCGVDPAAIVRFARRFAAAERPLAIAGGDAAQGSNATSTVVAVHALNALVGAFGREGGVVIPPEIPLAPLPPRQPVAASSLFSGKSPETALGIDPVRALVDSASAGSLEALVVIGANPVYDSPLGGDLRDGLAEVPLVVACAPFLDETAATADWVLPSPLYLESWQAVTTPAGTAAATLGLAEPVVEALYDSRHPGDLLIQLARTLGSEGAEVLPWDDWAGYLRQRVEPLGTSGVGAVISGSFEESWVRFLEERGWRFRAREAGRDFWPELVQRAGWWNPTLDRDGWPKLFRTPSGRFEFASSQLRQAAPEIGLEAGADEALLPRFEEPLTAGEGELVLVPYRPLTARGNVAAVSPMVAEMFAYPVLAGWETSIEIAPETAHHLDLGDGDLVRVESDRGSFEGVVRVAVGTAAEAAHVALGLGRGPGLGAGAGEGANPLSVALPVYDHLAGDAVAAATRVRLHLVRRRPHGGPAPVHGGEA